MNRFAAAWPHAGLAAVALSLAGCAGGGGSTAAVSTPVNRPPMFTSGATATAVENTTAPVYQAMATDPEGDPVTFPIVGGADAARFTITAAGQLSFIAPPSFDLATDADTNNVYEVQLAVSDGRLTTTLALTVTVTNSKEGVAVHRIATGFTDPVAIAPVSDAAMLVAEKGGAVYLFNPLLGTRALLIQIANVGSVGVVALAASPTYVADGSFYAMYTTSGGSLIVNRFLRNPAGPIVPDNSGPVLSAFAPQYAGGGWLGFDATGMLLAATGDAGGAGDPTGSAQDANSRLGKIIRIGPNADPYAGASPSFFSLTTIARGLHQPNGGSLGAGGLLIADRGQDKADEIDLLDGSVGLANFGWPAKEGTTVVRGPPPAAVDPVTEYFRGSGPRQGQAISGGARGPAGVATLRDQYIFADRGGAIFAVPVAALKAGATLASSQFERRDADFAPDQGTIEHPVAVTAGPGGTLYVVDAGGSIFRVDGN